MRGGEPGGPFSTAPFPPVAQCTDKEEYRQCEPDRRIPRGHSVADYPRHSQPDGQPKANPVLRCVLVLHATLSDSFAPLSIHGTPGCSGQFIGGGIRRWRQDADSVARPGFRLPVAANDDTFPPSWSWGQGNRFRCIQKITLMKLLRRTPGRIAKSAPFLCGHEYICFREYTFAAGFHCRSSVHCQPSRRG